MRFNKYFFTGILLLFFFLSGLLNSGSAQTVREYSRVDSLRAGDNFEFSITLNRSEDYDVIQFPDSSDFGELFEIRNKQQFKITAYKDSIRYQLQFFGTADTLLPSLPILLIQDQDTTRVYTNPVPIAFQSVLSDEEAQLRPFKPIFDFAAAWWPYLLAVLLLLLAAAAIYYYLSQKEPEKEPEPAPTFEPAPFSDPLKELQKTLSELKKAEPSTDAEFKEYYIRLGDAIREYFEKLYRIPALESTSREIIQQLDKRAIDEELVNDTREVLQQADMVKFAKFRPTANQADHALEKGYNFLNRARRVDGSKVEHLRRRHMAKVEQEKQNFKKQYKSAGEEV